MTKPIDAWFTNTNVPATGLSPKLYIILREDGSEITGSPFTMVEKGYGWYTHIFTQNGGKYLGMVDGGASILNPAERFKSVLI